MSSSRRQQRRSGQGLEQLARPRQPSPVRLPPHAGAAAAAAAARREGGGRNPAPSTRAPSWTIMIPSKPTTTCSPKRTGIETCSWTRPGRSSRERSVASPARLSPLFRPRWSQLRAPGSERVPSLHERGREMSGRWEVGCWVTGVGRSGESRCPGARERRARSARRWGRRWAGCLGARDPGHSAVAAPFPCGQGAGAVLGRPGLSPWLRSCLLRIDFAFPFPPPGRLSIWRAVAVRFLGCPGLSTWRGQAACGLCACQPENRGESQRRRDWQLPAGLPRGGPAGVGLGLRKLGSICWLPSGPCGSGVRTANRFITQLSGLVAAKGCLSCASDPRSFLGEGEFG